jgi:Protein of unknown function
VDRRLLVEPPVISSKLRWEDISLPASISEADLDRIIFSAMTSRLQKTAMVIVKTLQQCEQLNLPIDADIVGARLAALAKSGRIERAGDLRKWRYSEVRLKD